MSDHIRYETDNDSFDRDPGSMALINTDRNAYSLYKSRRKDALAARQLHNDVEELKSDIGEIKRMIQNLARG